MASRTIVPICIGVLVVVWFLGPPLRAPVVRARISGARDQLREGAGKLPAAFVENAGQLDEHVRFSLRQAQGTTYFTDTSFVFQLTQRERTAKLDTGTRRESVKGANVFLTFEGTSASVSLDGCGELAGRHNYFLGNDPSKWHRDVRTYGSLRYRGLYRGVDLEVRVHEGRLEYDLLLEPGADLHEIVVRCEGAESLSLDDSGSLVATTMLGPLTQPKPATHEIGPSGERLAIDCSFRLLDDTRFGFEASAWDEHSQLLIDPGLLWSTYLGGQDADWGT